MANKGKKIDVSLRPLQSALRRMGFVRTFAYGKSADMDGVQQYERDYPEDEVLVKVRLWTDGKHRVNYSHDNLFVSEDERSLRGCETTLPVDFETVEQMFVAIEEQRTQWLRSERAVEEEYVRECRASDEAISRSTIRERRAARAKLRLVQGGAS